MAQLDFGLTGKSPFTLAQNKDAGLENYPAPGNRFNRPGRARDQFIDNIENRPGIFEPYVDQLKSTPQQTSWAKTATKLIDRAFEQGNPSVVNAIKRFEWVEQKMDERLEKLPPEGQRSALETFNKYRSTDSISNETLWSIFTSAHNRALGEVAFNSNAPDDTKKEARETRGFDARGRPSVPVQELLDIISRGLGGQGGR